MKALLWLYMFVCHLDSIRIPLTVSISCMPNLADCEHPWESEFSEPQSMPISASAPVLVILRSIWLLCKERLFEHSHFWIEELEVSEFVCFLLPTLGTLVLLLSSQHIADAFSQECRYSQISSCWSFTLHHSFICFRCLNKGSGRK